VGLSGTYHSCASEREALYAPGSGTPIPATSATAMEGGTGQVSREGVYFVSSYAALSGVTRYPNLRPYVNLLQNQ
jgi:hypothetical protein